MSSSDWTPIETLLTPADLYSLNLETSIEVGLASNVTSSWFDVFQRANMWLIIASIVLDGIRLGVPPPKKTVLRIFSEE